jgi:hypothetical protein
MVHPKQIKKTSSFLKNSKMDLQMKIITYLSIFILAEAYELLDVLCMILFVMWMARCETGRNDEHKQYILTVFKITVTLVFMYIAISTFLTIMALCVYLYARSSVSKIH